MNGRMERPCFIGPFRPRPGVQQVSLKFSKKVTMFPNNVPYKIEQNKQQETKTFLKFSYGFNGSAFSNFFLS